MRTHKIAILALALGLFLACNNNGSVSRQEYEQLLQEYADLQAGADATREEYAAQAAAIDNILHQLSQISGRTVTLRTDIEHGTVALTQVQQIEESISDIKNQLAQLETLSAKSAQLQKLVGSLKAVIVEKEAEINRLKAEIQARDLTIDEQGATIDEQHSLVENQSMTITTQQENLRALLSEQAQMLFQAGVDFEALGDNAPQVGGRKNRKKVDAFALEMYQKAVLYFKQAQEAGYRDAGHRISVVEEKMAGLQ